MQHPKYIKTKKKKKMTLQLFKKVMLHNKKDKLQSKTHFTHLRFYGTEPLSEFENLKRVLGCIVMLLIVP